jgi:SecD/SecF fusion protein
MVFNFKLKVSMEKKSRWPSILILAVIVLTVYNILPTLFFYLKPLKSPITTSQAEEIAASIEERMENLEADAKDWIASYCKTLQIHPQSITPDGQNIIVSFAKTEEASRLRKMMPRAGNLIPFAPAQLHLVPQEDAVKEVIVQRKIPVSLEKKSFSFAPKNSPLYKEVILDRATQIAYALTGPSDTAYLLATPDSRHLESIALQIQSIAELASIDKATANRYAAHFTQGPFADRPALIKSLIAAFEKMDKPLFTQAKNFLKDNEALFYLGQNPLNQEEIRIKLSENSNLRLSNPLFQELSVDWTGEKIHLKLHPGVNAEKLKQPLINEMARITQFSQETVQGDYTISLHTHPKASGYLVVKLDEIVAPQAERIESVLKNQWHPKHPDLQNLQIVDATTYEKLSAEQKALSLAIHKPEGSNRAFFVYAKGLDSILKKYEEFPESEGAVMATADLQSLATLLQQNGFHGYRTQNGEWIFEKRDYAHSLLAATREDFHILGTQKYALLELSNLEERILTANRIDTAIHEDLRKWKDEYNAAQVSMQPGARFEIPKPTRNAFLSNVALTFKKFFRGDERKVIRWGLDLSGGKTVQIELRDVNNQIVTDENDLRQGINELYNRVNKMGVSEVAIRQLGHHIVLDFPGSQSLSAAELIKASSMYFHVVNEKFSSPYSPFADAASRFLSEVWNEAIVSQKKDAESINEIAYRHLYGEKISESARTLLENGLKLSSEKGQTLDSSTSKIALVREEARQPLLFVFSNYALEGSQLDRIQANYDPQKGNYLSFDVKGQKARESIQAWTSLYAKDRIGDKGEMTRGQGWRMAVILNDTVITSPTLNEALNGSASISGSFSQREVNQLASDLKAGSLSFTPHILSEKNVSPELGQKDRTQGITATVVALFLVIGAMIAYYRFAGFVASVAVLFNLLILWATLQNLGATLSLAGIAGIILTVGMAVDANVLVFERIKEELAHSGKIASAIAAGYKKAYSAIIDSNVTTIIAALILLNFDAGPIKGFAITLIIGIASSMFTALFMTRYYFDRWLENPKHKMLKMANWIQTKKVDFLKQAKLAFTVAALIIVAGSYLLYAQRNTLFGLDFTGGYSLQVEITPKEHTHYLSAAEKALQAQGATSQDFQIRELNPSNQLRILFGTSMEEVGKPFHNLPAESGPRIAWVAEALRSQGLELNQNQLEWTAMSGQMSESMRNNALIGLLISFVCIFIYIAFRFEYKFAAASIICLLHDVLITIGLVALLHFFGVPVQIDLNTVAAIMTIVGYSLNDTIIIFDRIREEIRLSPNKSLASLVNQALNATLSRTTITSGTTLLVLIALVLLGGSSIFSFALVMTIGVFFGTLSSWYIASPLMLFFHGKEEKNWVEQKS